MVQTVYKGNKFVVCFESCNVPSVLD